MASIEFEAFRALRDLIAATATEAIPAAEVAAARVFRNAARAAAPVQTVVKSRAGVAYDSAQLKSSISIIEGKDKSMLWVSADMGPSPRRRRLFVGPEKRKGYYGFFLEKGWQSSGKARAVTMRAPNKTTWLLNPNADSSNWRKTWEQRTRRIERGASAAGGSSQHGVEAARTNPPRPWFFPAIQGAEAAALAAAERAFNRYLEMLNSRK